MRRYIKIFAFILLMFLSTNVYAYNWCKGGTGANAYDICDYQWLREYNEGSAFNTGVNGSNKIQYDINFFRDFSSVGMDSDYDFWWNDEEDEDGSTRTTSQREELRATELEKIEYSNVITFNTSADARVMVYGSDLSNGFYSNIYLIKNDAFKSTFNSKVKVEKQLYKSFATEFSALPYEIEITIITTPVLSKTGTDTGKTNKIIVIKANGGITLTDLNVDDFVRASSSTRKEFTNKNKDNWPEDIYINPTHPKVLSLTKSGVNSIELSKKAKPNWCAGGEGTAYYNFCTVQIYSHNSTPGFGSTPLKDVIKSATGASSVNIPMETQIINNETIGLYIFTYNSSTKRVETNVNPNSYYMLNADYQAKFDKAVKVYSLSYDGLDTSNDYISVMMYITPIIKSDGSIDPNLTNRIVYVNYNKKISDGFDGLTLDFFLSFNKASSEWQKTIYLKDTILTTKFSYGSNRYSTVKNVDTNWCKGGTGRNTYDFCKVKRNKNQMWLKRMENQDGINYLDTATPGLLTTFKGNFLKNPDAITINTLSDMIGSKHMAYYPYLLLDVRNFSESGALIINGCTNGQWYKYSVTTVESLMYTNVNLYAHPEFRGLFDSKVEVKSHKYISSSFGDLLITGVHIPIIEEDGSIVNTQFILRIEPLTKKDLHFIFSTSEAKSFFDFNNWPDIISSRKDANDVGGHYLTANKNNNVKFYKDGFNQEAFDFDIETSECGGAAGIKTFVEDYLIKALHIIAPIILFALTTVDLVSGIMGKDGKGLNKSMQSFLKRAIVCILIFFAGNIMDLLLDVAGIERCVTVETDGDIVESETYPDYYEYYIKEFDD